MHAPATATSLQLPTAAIDSYFYGRPTIAALNILKYNVFSTGAGSELYGVQFTRRCTHFTAPKGTEPLSYYLVNLLLNFNLAFVTLVALLPVAVRGRSCAGAG